MDNVRAKIKHWQKIDAAVTIGMVPAVIACFVLATIIGKPHTSRGYSILGAFFWFSFAIYIALIVFKCVIRFVILDRLIVNKLNKRDDPEFERDFEYWVE